MIEIKSPNSIYPALKDSHSGPLIFLSGSIEMGKAIDWQRKVTESLKNERCVILNPRRDDSSWEQSITNEQFVDQVNWELNGLEKADLIAVNLGKDTKSPITLLEIGLYAQYDPDKMIIHCPEGFYRKGNIDVICQRYDILQVESLDKLIETIRDFVK